ncbi:hypothetical protein O181_127635 [Austropuccinia psidii MF-1]|uniref:Uncharacterized protein n=1 Tax=Austropuccinia psidii MF-1 TaxID=1389203 RepID=A0A9Q3KYT8_9BASI|nr:hypothetical protein [Austropuccinia psidii MF-1]
MLNRLNNLKNQPTNTQTKVITTPQLAKKTNNTALSYAEAIVIGAPKITHQLPKKPNFTTKNPPSSEKNKFKKFSIVIQTKFGATKHFEGKTMQESYKKVNKALMEGNTKQDKTPV